MIRSKPIGFRETFQMLFIATLIAIPVGVVLDSIARSQRESEWDGARIIDVSSRAGENARIALSWKNSTTAEFDLLTRDGQSFAIPIPLSKTRVRFFDDRGRTLDPPKIEQSNQCVRLVVDGQSVGNRGEWGSIICSRPGGEIIWQGIK